MLRLEDAKTQGALIAAIDGAGQLIARLPASPPIAARPIYSITKTYLASVAYHSEIDLDAAIYECVAEIPQADLPHLHGITVRQLLQHTSGIIDYGALPEYANAVASGEIWSSDTFARHTLQKPLLFEPGTGFSYSNPGYWLLKRVVEVQLKQPWEDLLRAYLRPLDLLDTRVVRGYFADDLPDYPAEMVWHGLICATPEDVARFVASDLVAPLVKETVAVGPAPGWYEPRYGYGVMIEAGQMYGHSGSGPGYSAACYRFPNLDLTVCVLARQSEDAAFQMLMEMVEPLL